MHLTIYLGLESAQLSPPDADLRTCPVGWLRARKLKLWYHANQKTPPKQLQSKWKFICPPNINFWTATSSMGRSCQHHNREIGSMKQQGCKKMHVCHQAVMGDAITAWWKTDGRKRASFSSIWPIWPRYQNLHTVKNSRNTLNSFKNTRKWVE